MASTGLSSRDGQVAVSTSSTAPATISTRLMEAPRSPADEIEMVVEVSIEGESLRSPSEREEPQSPGDELSSTTDGRLLSSEVRNQSQLWLHSFSSRSSLDRLLGRGHNELDGDGGRSRALL